MCFSEGQRLGTGPLPFLQRKQTASLCGSVQFAGNKKSFPALPENQRGFSGMGQGGG
jgi:hypothetical protein